MKRIKQKPSNKSFKVTNDFYSEKPLKKKYDTSKDRKGKYPRRDDDLDFLDL